jgi:hypothetical protein
MDAASRIDREIELVEAGRDGSSSCGRRQIFGPWDWRFHDWVNGSMLLLLFHSVLRLRAMLNCCAQQNGRNVFQGRYRGLH